MDKPSTGLTREKANISICNSLESRELAFPKYQKYLRCKSTGIAGNIFVLFKSVLNHFPTFC